MAKAQKMFSEWGPNGILTQDYKPPVKESKSPAPVSNVLSASKRAASV